jgi:GT2 family glycosyltransferase
MTGTDSGEQPVRTTERSTELSVLVVSYNTRELTLEALRSLYRETTTPFELIVVDNASADGSAAAIAAEFPQADLVALDDNVGFAAGNNIAAGRARGELLLLLNPDTIVLDRAVDRLVEFARRRPAARIWGGRTLFGDRSLNPASCWRRQTGWTAWCRTLGLDVRFPNRPWANAEAYGGWPRDTERDVDIVSGCFFLVEADLWHDLGGFDETFVMYGEEADLCLRAAARGARPRITPTAEIVHYGGASETVRSDKHIRLLKAKITLAQRHLPRWQAMVTMTAIRAWPASRYAAAAVLRRLRPGGSFDRVHDEWRAVWAARREWWNGYPAVTNRSVPS